MTHPTDTQDTVRALHWSDAGLNILDQRKLPAEICYQCCETSGQVSAAIASMQVRGAPAIGIAAAYGVVLAARLRHADHPLNWKSALSADLEELARSRPTAVNLFWALNRMQRVIDTLAEADPTPVLLAEARAIHEADIAANHTMGRLGAALLEGSSGLLTHCNTGSLATGGFGTALGVVRTAHAAGLAHIYATETRPWLQGARLTIWELEQDGIPATLIADSSASCLMRLGRIQWVIVGADRIAANGDTANKIGTYALAVAAKYHRVRFMVVAPTSTIDWNTQDGSGIEIEERHSSELLSDYFQREDSLIQAWNPVFDVTPHELIDAIVTERGIVQHPTAETLSALR
ncbi:MAG: S-methyl-5-thioribose-1-phosphate isomerase [Methylococcaceae bacterium]